MKKYVITIIGLGVIGGSYAMALSKIGHTVYGVDTNEDSIKKAIDLKYIADGGTDGKRFFEQSDIIVIAVYPQKVTELLDGIVPYVKDNCILTDVAGIKSHFIEDIENILPCNIDFVFAHPMAGREKKGIDYADDNVFKGANFIITPSARNKEENINIIQSLAKDMGFKNVMRLSAKEHDEIIAFVSQLPHAIAVALVNSDSQKYDTPRFVGDSYRDLTRIANINEDLWCELFFCNKKNLLDSIKEFENYLDQIKVALLNDDKDALKQSFIKATERRIKFNKEL